MKHKLLLKYPSSIWGARWKDALPSGNGKIGAAVYGGVYDEKVMLTHEDLWWQSVTPPLPDVSDQLPEVRRLLFEGKAHAADRIIADTLKERGFAPQLACPLPLGDFRLRMPGEQAFKHYKRVLDMETGEITVTWMDGNTRFNRKLFVSRVNDLIVCELEREGPSGIQVTFSLDLHDRNDKKTAFDLPDSKLPEEVEFHCEESYLFYAARNDDGTDFGAVGRLMVSGGKLTCGKDGIHVTDADRILIFLRVFVKGERRKNWAGAKQALAAVGGSYEEHLEAHRVRHAALFKAMSFDLHAEGRERSNEELLMDAYQGEAPSALVEKMWAFGRYLLISSSRQDGHPCPLMGLWCGEYQGFWAFNMTNENLQMNYWQALSGNMPELLLAVFDYCERLMDDFRTNARQIYGCRGIFIPAPTSPDSGLLKTPYPHIIHWTGAAGWISQLYYDYYLYTGDTEFLRHRAIPFLKEAASFYEDFFLIGDDGYYISCPSNSPENTPGNYWRGEGTDMETTINATMDFAIAKEVLTHLIEGAQILGTDTEKMNEWKAMLVRIPPYQVNEDGAVREWMHPYFEDNYHHRHQSHIYPVFPGTEITRANQSELFAAFVTAVKKRLILGLKEQSGWSLAHMANIYARMREGDLALECLDILSRSCVISNFFTLHNDWRQMGICVDLEWAPFQIDANMGWSAAVQEMLLFSLPGQIYLLPALPQKWRRGKAENMLAKGGVTVSVSWDQDAGRMEVELYSANDLSHGLDLILPYSAHTSFNHTIVSGARVANISMEAGQRISFVMERFA